MHRKILLLSCLVVFCITTYWIFNFFSNIPNYDALKNYSPNSITRMYSDEGTILSEYAIENRVYTYYNEIPRIVIEAFIAVEDKNFFKHTGLDFLSITRALLQNIINISKGQRVVGGSTITQQIAKTFFLSGEKKLSRKLKEAVLAFRMSKIFTKEKLLEIYLNQIYLGNGSYGIYTATKNYFGKTLNDITIPEAALLAALPKAPSILNPYKNYERALERRNWAIKRMKEEGFISKDEEENACKKAIFLNKPEQLKENYYTNLVKSELIEILGEKNFYTKGYTINTNLNTHIQNLLDASLRKGLEKFDKRSGWRGPIAKLNISESGIKEKLESIKGSNYYANFELAVVTKIDEKKIELLFSSGKKANLGKTSWAKSPIKEGYVLLVDKENYNLEQIPEINGAAIVIENRTGKILALTGGYDFQQSKFNRATQAYRQPGSAFKTFLYLAALEQGIEPNTILLDEPLEIDLGYSKWQPKNYQDKYSGLITLRKSFEKSSNLAALRLLLGIGLKKLKEIGERYNIYGPEVKPTYAMALGAFETTLLKLTNAYASIGNNGILNSTKLIDSVYDRNGNLAYKASDISFSENSAKTVPQIYIMSKIVTDTASNYQILSLLEGTVQNGSAQKAKQLKRFIAGKTGTTNDSKDAWFIGMTADITVGIVVGYDTPKSMGKNATGSSIALPIFIDFFKNAKFIPNRKFYMPDSIEIQYIDAENGEVLSDKEVTKKQSSKEFFKNHKVASRTEKAQPKIENSYEENIFDLLNSE